MIFTPLVPKHAQASYRWDARSAWLFGLYSGMSVPFFGVIARRMGASDFEMEMIVASTAIGNLLALLVTNFMANRAKKPFMYWLTMVARGILLLMAFATTRPCFVALVFLNQMMSSLSGPAYATIMKSAYPDDCRGQVMGMVRLGATLSAMAAGLYAGHLLGDGLQLWWAVGFAVVAAGLVAHEMPTWPRRVLIGLATFGGVLAMMEFLAHPDASLAFLPWLQHAEIAANPHRVVFPLAGLLGMLSMWTFNHLPEKPPTPAAIEASQSLRENVGRYMVGLGEMLKVPIIDWRFGLYCAAFLVFGFGNWLRGPLVPMLQVDELHLDNATVGLLAMVTSGVSLFAYVGWGWVMDRYDPFITLIISFVLQGIVPVFFALTYAGPHATTLLLVASVAQGLVGPAVELGSLNSILHFARGEQIPVYMALHSFLVGIRGVIAPFLGTGVFLSIFPLHACFLVSAVIVWAGFISMLLVVWLVIYPATKAAREQQRATRAAQQV